MILVSTMGFLGMVDIVVAKKSLGLVLWVNTRWPPLFQSQKLINVIFDIIEADL